MRMWKRRNGRRGAGCFLRSSICLLARCLPFTPLYRGRRRAGDRSYQHALPLHWHLATRANRYAANAAAARITCAFSCGDNQQAASVTGYRQAVCVLTWRERRAFAPRHGAALPRLEEARRCAAACAPLSPAGKGAGGATPCCGGRCHAAICRCACAAIFSRVTFYQRACAAVAARLATAAFITCGHSVVSRNAAFALMASRADNPLLSGVRVWRSVAGAFSRQRAHILERRRSRGVAAPQRHQHERLSAHARRGIIAGGADGT